MVSVRHPPKSSLGARRTSVRRPVKQLPVRQFDDLAKHQLFRGTTLSQTGHRLEVRRTEGAIRRRAGTSARCRRHRSSEGTRVLQAKRSRFRHAPCRGLLRSRWGLRQKRPGVCQARFSRKKQPFGGCFWSGKRDSSPRLRLGQSRGFYVTPAFLPEGCPSGVSGRRKD